MALCCGRIEHWQVSHGKAVVGAGIRFKSVVDVRFAQSLGQPTFFLSAEHRISRGNANVDARAGAGEAVMNTGLSFRGESCAMK